MRRRSFLQISAAAAVSGLSGRSWATDTPTSSDLSGDVSILREALKMHPGLHRYASPTEIDARLTQFRRDFVSAGSLERRYLVLSRFLSTIRCGHSYANFYNQKKPFAAALFDRPTRPPFHFVWVGAAMVVTDDPGGALRRGTEIISLNGRTPAELRAALLPYIRADGHNDAKRISLLEVRGDDEIETFDVFQGLIVPPANGVHRLTVRDHGRRGDRAIELPAIGLAARRSHMSAETKDGAQLWDWKVRPDGIAVLTMPGWSVWNSKWDWKDWLKTRLDSLDGARGLIVDLRANEGGAACGDLILSRLIDRSFVPPALQQRLRFRRTDPALDPYLDTWDDSFRTLGVGAQPLSNGFYLRPDAQDTLSIEPAPKRLPVPLAVLISPVNSSATYQFAGNVRAIGRGALVGRATGGNRRGINGGCFFFVRLPASGIEFDLPLVGYFPLARQPDAGIEPDIRVALTAHDLAAGRDVAMERAAAHLRRS